MVRARRRGRRRHRAQRTTGGARGPVVSRGRPATRPHGRAVSVPEVFTLVPRDDRRPPRRRTCVAAALRTTPAPPRARPRPRRRAGVVSARLAGRAGDRRRLPGRAEHGGAALLRRRLGTSTSTSSGGGCPGCFLWSGNRSTEVHAPSRDAAAMTAPDREPEGHGREGVPASWGNLVRRNHPQAAGKARGHPAVPPPKPGHGLPVALATNSWGAPLPPLPSGSVPPAGRRTGGTSGVGRTTAAPAAPVRLQRDHVPRVVELAAGGAASSGGIGRRQRPGPWTAWRSAARWSTSQGAPARERRNSAGNDAAIRRAAEFA